MTYKGLERASVIALPPVNVRQYLRASGWSRLTNLPEHVRSEIAIFRREYGEELQEIVFPLQREDDEYFFRRMAEAISDLADYEARSVEDILADLSTGDADVVQFHVDDPSVADGTILIEDGLNLFGGARRALLSSACSVVEPLPYYPRLRRSAASEFIKACRMSSASGSFIARVICPLNAVGSIEENLQLSLDEQNESVSPPPFTRQVTQTLMQALQTLVRATDLDDTERLFEDPTSNHINANLCDALLEMQPSGRNSTLTIRTFWASSARPRNTFSDSIALRAEHFTIVERLANSLRPIREQQDSSFVGTVDELAGSPGADGRPEGRVTLRLQEGDDLLTAHVELKADEYARAANAHLSNQHIEIWGTLRRRARIHRITGYNRFEILDSNHT